MDGVYNLRPRGPVRKKSLEAAARRRQKRDGPPGPHPAQDMDTSRQEDSVRQRHGDTVRPKSARVDRRTTDAPPPGFVTQQDSDFSEDEEPRPPQSTWSDHPVHADGLGPSPSSSGHCPPSPYPTQTPKPVTKSATGEPQSSLDTVMPQTAARTVSNGDWDVRKYVVVPVILMLIVLVLVWWYWSIGFAHPPLVDFAEPSPRKAGLERWRDQVTALKSRFPYQRPRLWKVLRAAVSHMLLEARQPAVVLLLASEPQRDDVRCVLRAAADAVLNATRSTARPLRVDGAVLETLDEQEAKGRLNSQLEMLRGDRSSGVGVFMLEELQRLQPLTAMLLHGFCDNDNAPRKEALFLLSVVTSRTPPGDTDVERAVEYALWQAWGQVLSEDIFHALLGRIAGNVAAVTDEGSELLCHKTDK